MGEKSLVIVESPAKAKTIGKFLGSKYKVVASVGHVRDLPKSKMGINIENGYEPEYITIRGKGNVIKEMKKEAKKADKIMLATDPDREGEAISWHIAYLLGINENEKCRIEFNEITKEAVVNAVKKPRKINKNLVNAQQARRILDRLVGYNISPLLWKKIKKGLSAGRVQSAALKMICDREKAISEFVPKEYWNITAVLSKAGRKDTCFSAKLSEHQSQKILIESKEQAERIAADLKMNAYVLNRIEKKERIRKPLPPFTTSSLQQEASNKLGFFAKRTMLTAQQLYEGVDIAGEGTVGLITYIRTDSVRISAEAQNAAKAYIAQNFGREYAGNHIYTNKKKDIQDAHEAIRPSSVYRHPEQIKDSLTKDQYKLYKLIWERFLGSQMESAVYDSVSFEILNNGYMFKATGSRLKFDGFLKIAGASDEDEHMLPELSEGETLELIELKSEQHFTQPPSRYTEAGLVKDLEEKNIGRPSTYAPIITTLLARKYIKRDKKVLSPTELGFVVTDLMEQYFKNIVDAGFTAEMEEKLDDIEAESVDWQKIVDEFYMTLKKELDIADEEIGKIKIEDELTDEICELCGKRMAIKHGRYGEFLACSGYPECKNTKPIVNRINVKCPECGKDIIARKSKKGRLFYGCSGYPECTYMLWSKPVNKTCPECGSLLIERKTKTSNYRCSNAQCSHKE